MNNNICAIIVTYNPDPTDVKTLIERITPSVDRIVIVDNGSKDHDTIMAFANQDTKVEICFLGENFGVATAQNVGIKLALEDDFRFVILFDHDSLPAIDMIPRLLDTHETLISLGVRVAALGPVFRFRNTGKRIRDLSEERPFFKEGILFASGCLISVEALYDVGLMLDDFFLDYIDVEWCIRTTEKYRKHNKKIETNECWKIFTVCDAYMGHSNADGTAKFGIGYGGMIGGLFGGTLGIFGAIFGLSLGDSNDFSNTVINAIIFGIMGGLFGGVIARLKQFDALYYANLARYYYRFRNAIYLCTRSNFMLHWKIRIAMLHATEFAMICLGVFPNRFSILKLVLRGIWHGIIGKLGPISGAPIKDEITYTLVSQGSVKEKLYKISDSAINSRFVFLDRTSELRRLRNKS